MSFGGGAPQLSEQKEHNIRGWEVWAAENIPSGLHSIIQDLSPGRLGLLAPEEFHAYFMVPIVGRKRLHQGFFCVWQVSMWCSHHVRLIPTAD